ncbi:tRNA pseudouridine(38-40) synthase TruA [Candidatus Aerophobetes bacterium]|uniref:tRNA pseudouridine synthase A n=1 Tax=Aerophobetes bacterium TaxID=2030807 RepID=A0A2A4X5Y6_UNCAE|nr:MAG: tRNA pseudouridine(38-40) synthase TruA [Candidatus Aerophobetes bacterium]
MEHRFKLIVSYDGTDFFGWQHSQKDLATIEATLSAALEKIFNQPLKLEAASRTDAGVHAQGQVVCFSVKGSTITTGQLQLSLNQMLPRSIRVFHVDVCALDFYPSIHVLKKSYQYHITTGPYHHPFDRFYSWHILSPLCLKSIKAAMPHFLGTHDFTAFVNQGNTPYANHTRTLFDLSLEQTGPQKYTFNVCGDSFMYKMVRNIVGTLVHVGKKRIDPENIPAIIAGKNRVDGGETAPAQGLFLQKVYYKQHAITEGITL